MKVYTITSEQYTTHANDAVDSFIAGLYNEKVITKEQFDEYRKYRVVAVEPTFWGTCWNILTGKKDMLTYYVVKPIGTYIPK
jgi:hypothetical protein